MSDRASDQANDRPNSDIVLYDRAPDTYHHWRLDVDGTIATLTLAVDEHAGLRGDYKLKLNSYDLGVDMELHDALQRLRFEHPCVRTVVMTSGLERMFCAGANIYMLGTSSHEWKVNFCKFTNETRNSMEDSSANEGLKFLAALNGTAAGGGYEMALCCDEILLVDDRSSSVSLPEVPLLGVLPGTGGLTRVVDKRGVRRDLADVFCTSEEGVRGRRAKEWGLVDHTAPRQGFDAKVRERAEALGEGSIRPSRATGVPMTPLERRIEPNGYFYRWVDAVVDEGGRVATLTVRAPGESGPGDLADIHAAGMSWWPLAMARELEDAILMLRTNNQDVGLWLLKTKGDPKAVLAVDWLLRTLSSDWFVRETVAQIRRTFSRLDVSSRSLFALIEEGSCFAGTLAELALAADRGYMLDPAEGEGTPPELALSEMNFGPLVMANGLTRLATRFNGDAGKLAELKIEIGQMMGPQTALAAGLVTFAPDDLDWEDEIRLAIEGRVALSPDALTGMEANLRFAGPETLATKVFGRLSAWQNWIFYRPNAVGDKGALKLFGTGSKAQFDWKRV